MTRVVNIDHEKYDVYIGRAGNGKRGPLGNPIKKGLQCQVCGKKHRTPGETVPCFAILFYQRLETDYKYKQLVLNCKDKDLGCFCRPKEGFLGQLLCHGQVIAGYLDNIKPEDVE